MDSSWQTCDSEALYVLSGHEERLRAAVDCKRLGLGKGTALCSGQWWCVQLTVETWWNHPALLAPGQNAEQPGHTIQGLGVIWRKPGRSRTPLLTQTSIQYIKPPSYIQYHLAVVERAVKYKAWVIALSGWVTHNHYHTSEAQEENFEENKSVRWRRTL